MKHRARQLVTAAALAATAPFLSGFVLLSSHEAKLPVSVDSPTLTFNWDGNSPSITGKDEFLGGRYQDLGDDAFMEAVINEAMALWNAVPGSYVKLAVAAGPATMDPTDKVFSIVTKANANHSSAAFAVPEMAEGDLSTIDDCDVTISDRSTAAKDLAFTLTHELGHCLGLGHAHSNYDAIMGYSRSARDLRLGADDMAGLVYLYPDPTVVANKPKEIICGTTGGTDRDRRSNAMVLVLTLPLLTTFLLSRKARATSNA